tara:strand:- start:47466 stop:47663 length:198 start_codon:yes stop_codon:yes gene_type:complete
MSTILFLFQITQNLHPKYYGKFKIMLYSITRFFKLNHQERNLTVNVKRNEKQSIIIFNFDIFIKL